VTGALLGVAISAALWWAYFDVVAIVAERRLRDAPYDRQIRIARDSYTYLHLPMVAGIVVFAVGAKRALEVSGELPAVPAWALCAGVALYLVALSAFKRRNVGSWNRPRLVAAVALVALAPVATQLPALVSLTAVALVVCALIAFEVTVYSAARERIRHAA
jgi:low temperature requirement protein LtrA